MNYDVIIFILKYRYFKKAWSIHFCWHYQNYNKFIKNIKKTPEKLKELEIMFQNANISVYPDISNFADFRWKNANFSRTQGVCHVILIFFGSALGKVQLCQVSSL